MCTIYHGDVAFSHYRSRIFTEHFIKNTMLGSQISLNSLWYFFSTRCLEMFLLWDSGLVPHVNSWRFLSCAFMLWISSFNTSQRFSTEFRCTEFGSPLKKTELIVEFMNLAWDEFVTWCMKVAIRRWVNCGHEGMHSVCYNMQIICDIQAND